MFTQLSQSLPIVTERWEFKKVSIGKYMPYLCYLLIIFSHYPLTRVKCDYCKKVMQSQYHMTLSDQTVRNFCTYQCIVAFQNQYPTVQISYNQERPTQTGPQTRRSHSTRITRSTTIDQPGNIKISSNFYIFHQFFYL